MPRKSIEYTEGEIGKVRVVSDFLPSPDTLVAREENVKVTVDLSRRSVDDFKRAAEDE
jgi:hypothetical protein